ncbi:hypothetical protein [Sphingomonas sp.]|uniref:hypothetical protein n=1 Tax=Sphingomonas sp. TaxID=28214 RepID=UPI0035C7F22F
MGGRDSVGDLRYAVPVNTRDPLFAFTAPPNSGAGFIARKHGGLVSIEPITGSAQAWLHAQVNEEASWAGDALVLEPRYFPELADAIMAAGFTFEREALPN